MSGRLRRDGKFDIASTFGLSANNYIVQRRLQRGDSRQWGNFNTDWIAPGDYDGDGIFDLTAVRTGALATSPMVWWILQSTNGQVRTQTFGISSDFPTQGDYDGDGTTDIAVWRQGATTGAQSFYHAYGSLNGYILTPWGIRGDFTVNRFDAR